MTTRNATLKGLADSAENTTKAGLANIKTPEQFREIYEVTLAGLIVNDIIREFALGDDVAAQIRTRYGV